MDFIQKVCDKHGLTDFYIQSRSSRPTSSHFCKKCNVERVTRRRRKLKVLAINYLGNQCFDCKVSFIHNSVYDFHHKDVNQKDFNISCSGNTKSWEKLKIELDKCVLLCANCHRIRHALEHNPGIEPGTT